MDLVSSWKEAIFFLFIGAFIGAVVGSAVATSTIIGQISEIAQNYGFEELTKQVLSDLIGRI